MGRDIIKIGNGGWRGNLGFRVESLLELGRSEYYFLQSSVALIKQLLAQKFFP